MANSIIRSELLETGNRLLFLTLVIATFLAFWKLGTKDIEDWDEARQVITAVEMEHRGNYFDYFYADKIDTWNAKPPLLIWSMVGAYKLLGPSIFSSRLPSAVAAITFFFLVFSFVNLYRSKFFAFGVCLVLMSCRAVFEPHIGRTADFDAFLILFLAGFTYCFALHHDFKHRYAILGAGVFLGLAFYCKGTTSVFLLPGAVLYSLISGTILSQLKSKTVWVGLAIYAMIAGSWFFISATYGASFNEAESIYGNTNSVNTMLINDTWDRFVGNAAFEDERGGKPFYFFVILDILMNVWGYVFYLGVIIGIYSLVRSGKEWIGKILSKHNRLLTLSFCTVLTIMLLLEMSATKMGWYYAPMFMFIAIIVMETVKYLAQINRVFRSISLLLFAGLLVRHFMFIDSLPQKTTPWLESNREAIAKSDKIYLIGDIRPSVYAQLKLINYHTHIGAPAAEEVTDDS
ncbi:MAG: 4-amino-4-deoxy-L-arabinose transferase-like glycosyltransferase, partial [Bacteroidia bacterium]